MKLAWIFSLFALILCQSNWTEVHATEVEELLAECRSDYYVVFLDSASGKREIVPSDVITGNTMGYTVTVAGTTTDTVDCSHAGKRVLIQVTPPAGGAAFFCNVMVEDNTPPTLVCPDTLVDCNRDLFTSPPDSFYIEYFDACGIDTLYPILCGAEPGNCIDTAKIIKVLWQAIDSSGNLSSCTQFVAFAKPSIADIVPPSDTTIYCDSFDLNLAGEPVLFDSTPIGKNCGLILSYLSIDTTDICGGEKWITRHWSVLDMCTLESRDSVQMIFVRDSIGPRIDCPEVPDSLYLTYNDTICGQAYELPELAVEASCSEIIQTAIQFDGAFHSAGDTIQLDTGTNVIRYIATDACWKMDTCDLTVELVDTLRPVLNCPASICDPVTNDALDSMAIIDGDCEDLRRFYFPNPGLVDTSPCCPFDTIECFKVNLHELGTDTLAVLKYVAKDSCGRVSDTCFQFICKPGSIIPQRVMYKSVVTPATGRIQVIPNPTSSTADLILSSDIASGTKYTINLSTIDGAVVRQQIPRAPGDFRIPLQLDEFPPGIIIIRVVSDDQKQILRLIKQ